MVVWKRIPWIKRTDVLPRPWNLGLQLCADYWTLLLWTREILRERDCIRNWTRYYVPGGILFHSDFKNSRSSNYS